MKDKNKYSNETKEIEDILDKEYFHTMIEFDRKGNVYWAIFYKNLPKKVYFSKNNKPLLTSKENGISDIYKLRDKFEYEKSKEYMKNISEMIKISSKTNKGFENLTSLFSMYYSIVMFLILIILLINIKLNNFTTSICMLCFTLISGVSGIVIREKMAREIEKTNKKIKEQFVKDKIFKMGLYFVEKIKI